jgi:hypothetical protein
MTTNPNPISGKPSPNPREEKLQELLKEFNGLFPTVWDCLMELFKYLFFGQALKCKTCGSAEMETVNNDRAGICRLCGEITWFTSGTFFERMKKPRAWLLAIWLLEQGESFNAAELARLADIADSTAGAILKKIAMVIQEDLKTAAGMIAGSSALFLDAIYKRSLKTPADKHPIAEQTEIEKTLDEEASLAANLAGEKAILPSPQQLSGLAQEVFDALSTEPMNFNDLCSKTGKPAETVGSILIILELNGLVESRPGDKYLRAIPEAIAAPLFQPGEDEDDMAVFEASVGAIVSFVRSQFHGISRKYLQLYLAVHWCLLDRKRWSHGSLLQACSRFRAVRSRDLLAYVSPLYVKLMPC